MKDVSIINIGALLAVFLLFLVNPLVGLAQDNATPCWAWGGSNSAGQGQFVKCPERAPTVVTVTKTEVREVKVPVPVPGPVQRIEVPAPVAPKIRN